MLRAVNFLSFEKLHASHVLFLVKLGRDTKVYPAALHIASIDLKRLIYFDDWNNVV